MEKVFIGAISDVEPAEATKAARALLDFIYFAQYKSLDDEQLAKMDDALAMFHQHKHIFERNGIRGDFNIPKLHSIVHYTYLIRQFGTPDGYNTESPERLHIDFAKQAYRASNKRDYTIQMTRWLSRQESVHKRRSYLEWLQTQTDTQILDELDHSSDGSDWGSDESEPDADPTLLDGTSLISVKSIFSHAKSPPLPNIATTDIIEHFAATRFTSALRDWLSSLPSSTKWNPPSVSQKFNLYKKVNFSLGVLDDPDTVLSDAVRAYPAKPQHLSPKGFARLGKGTHFDTVLVRTSEGMVLSSI